MATLRFIRSQKQHQPAIISVLHNAGAVPDTHTNGSFTVLHTAAAQNKNPAIFTTLLDLVWTPWHEVRAAGQCFTAPQPITKGFLTWSRSSWT